MSEDGGADAKGSGKPSASSSGGGRRSSLSAAADAVPEIFRSLPETDRFLAAGFMAVVVLILGGLYFASRSPAKGSSDARMTLWLVGGGVVMLFVMFLIGLFVRARVQRAEPKTGPDAETEPEPESESQPTMSPSGAVLALELSAGAALVDEESIHKRDLIEVFRAYDTVLERPVAKKVLCIPERRQDFVDGAREAMRIADFPNFTTIYGADFRAEQPYILMQFVEGGTLRKYIEDQGVTPIPPKVARRIVFEVGEAVFRAHQASVRIGNIKASNILFDHRDEPYIAPRTSLKFVSAKQLRSAVLERALTLEDIVYTAPELLIAEQAKDARGELCDQYALGILAYELLTSQLPPTLPTVTAQPDSARVEASCRLLLDKGVGAYESLVPLHELRPEIPTRVSEIIQKMTALDPEQRYARLDLALAALRSAERMILLIARDSYVRCLASERSPSFLECFYELFTASPDIAARFDGFSTPRWTAQHGKLQAALEACFDFAQLLDPKLDIVEPNSMSNLARIHGKDGLAIKPEEYEQFIDALVRTVCGEPGRAPYDPECEDAGRHETIERAWRGLLSPVIDYLSGG